MQNKQKTTKNSTPLIKLDEDRRSKRALSRGAMSKAYRHNEEVRQTAKFTQQQGISIIGLLLAIAIFAFSSSMIVALIMGSLAAVLKSENQLKGQFIARQAYEGVRNIRDIAWNDLEYDQSAIAQDDLLGWHFLGEGTTELIEEYTRIITFEDVCRSTTHNIVNCPGEYADVNAKKVNIEVSWPVAMHQLAATTSAEYTTYLTNWEGPDWIQTDWSGGPGQAVWSDTTFFDAYDDNFLHSDAGQIELYTSVEGGGWLPSGGFQFTDTTDTDFNTGTHMNTKTIRADQAASVSLDQSQIWKEHPQSTVVTPEDINDISSLASNNIWAVGNSGKIFQNNGTTWVEHSDVGASDLSSITMLSASDGWAAGSNGEVYQFNGSTWTNPINIPNVTNSTFAEFSPGNHSDTVATSTGDGELILDETLIWAESMESGVATTEDLHSFSVLAWNDVFAVGDSGKVMHYDGNVWTQSNDVGTDLVYDIDMLSPTDGWAVGESAKFYHWDGVSWYVFQDLGASILYSIDMISPTEGWATGDSGQLYYFNGVDWTQSQDLGNHRFYDLHMLSSTDGWAVANGGRIAHYDGVSWSQVQDTGAQTWYSIDMLSPSDGWISGSGGQVFHYNGASWVSHSDTGGQTWYGIDMVSPTLGYISGSGGEIQRWNGATWVPEVSVVGDQLNAIIYVNDENIWAVGNNGTIAQYRYYYLPSGFYESIILDSTETGPVLWGTASWSETMATGSAITVQVRAGDTSNPDGSWSGWSSELSVSSGTSIPTLSGRYIQYRANLTRATNPIHTPWLEDIKLTFNEPPQDNINDLSIVTANNYWVVGDNGYIAHFTPSTMTPAISPVPDNLNTVDMTSAIDGWAAGENGKILYFDGVDWTEYADTGTHNWTSLAMLSSTEGWLVGSEGKVYYYNGFLWSEYDDTGGMQWNDIHMFSPTSGVAVANGGEIFTYNGTTWQATTSPTTTNLNAINMTSATNGWTAGTGGYIASYGLNHYSSGTFLSQIFDGIEVDPGWDSIYWQENLPSDSDITIQTRTGTSPTPDGSWTDWSAEMTDEALSIVAANQNDRYLQYRANLTINTAPSSPELDTITITYAGATSFRLNAISALDENEAWAVGNTGEIAHYDGVGWIAYQNIGGTNLNGVDTLATNNAWAVGDGGKIFHYDGLIWTEFEDTGGNTWYAIDMISPTEGWMVGNSGAIWYFDGFTWTEFTDMGNQDVYSIYMLSSTEGWAGADNGEIYYYDGVSWTEIVDTGVTDWFGIHMIDSNDGWIVGSGGDIRRYDGANWNAVDSSVGDNLNGLDVLGTDDAIAIGENGTIITWDGVSWTEVDNSNTEDLYAVDLVDNSLGWVVGFKGVVSMNRDTSILIPPLGILTSSAFFIGSGEYPVETIEWDQTIPPECAVGACAIKFEIRTADDFFNSPNTWTSWYGSDGQGTYLEDYHGSLIPNDVNWNQWIQYRLTMTSDGAISPILEEVRINYKD